MTSRQRRAHLVAGIVAIVLGVLYAVLPLDWVERHWHVSPDAGSGLFELLVPVALVAAGLALVLRAAVDRHRRRTSEPTRTDG